MKPRDRRSRPPTGKTNLLRSGSSTFINPVVASMKRAPVVATGSRPATASAAGATHFVQTAPPATATSGAKTRSELLARRRHSRLHFFDRYDLNGDGVVDPFEVRLGALVDLNHDGVIDEDEKAHLRDLIEQGVLKHMSILQDKRGGAAKAAMTWVGSKEYRREQHRKAAEREARDRRRCARAAADEELRAVHEASLGGSGATQASSTHQLLTTLSKAMSPTKVLQRLLKPVFHKGHGPMERVMTGRHTPSLEYRASPLHRTRSELMAERRARMVPHASFDLDGDGTIDPLEHYIASMLDLNNDGSLDAEEKAQAKQLIDRLKKYYVMGLDRGGPAAPGEHRISQRPDGTVMKDMAEYSVSEGVPDAIPIGAKPVTAATSTASRPRGASPPAASPVHTPGPYSPGRPASHSIWSPPASAARRTVLSRAASTSMADDLRNTRRQLSGRMGMTRDPDTGAEVMRLTPSRPSTGMSRLVGM